MISDPLPTVSIITPSFNQARYIEATIQSVLSQDYPNIEYLVMDGGSTDGTIDILRRYDARLKWISQPDKGQSDAIIKGFAQTTGPILGWLNSDDTYAPGAIRAAAEFLRDRSDAAMVYGDADFIDVSGNLIRPCAHIEPFNRHRLLHYSDFIVQPAAFFRRSAYDAVGGIDPSLYFAMDYDLWLKLAKEFEIAYLPKVLANFRWIGGNKSAVGGWKRINEVARVAKRHGARRLPAFFRLEAVNLYLEQGRDALAHRKFAAMLRSLASATASLISSPRAMRSLLSPRTWRVIRTGRVLRAAPPG